MKTQRKLTHNSRQPLFFPFSAFPRTGPSMSLANILRHLWELSHGDSLSAGGSPVSGMAALPAAAASRGQQRGVFFPHCKETMTQYHSDPDELFLPDGAVSPRDTNLPRHYTRTQASLWRWESLSYYVTQKPSAWTTEERADVTGHPFRQPETRRTSRHIAELWLRLFWYMKSFRCPRRILQLVLLFRSCIPVFGCARGSSPEQLRATLITEASSVQASETKHVGRCWNVSFDFNIVETCWLVQYFIIWKVKWADRKYVL